MMTNLEKKRRNTQFQKTFIFLIGFSFWIMSFFMQRLTISNNFNSSYLTYIRLAGLIFVLGSEIFSFNDLMSGHNYVLKKIIPSLFLAIFILINNYYLSDKSWFVDIIVIIFCARDINYKQFLTYTFGLLVVYYLSVIFAYAVGLIPASITYRSLGTRNSLGFGWSTWPAFGFFYISLIYMVLRGKRVTYIELLIVTGIASFFYYMTTTRYAYFLTLLVVLIWLFKKVTKFNFYGNAIVRTGIYILMPLLTVVIYFFSKNVARFSELDELFSGRLTLGNMALQRYGIKLLGRQTVFSTSRDTIGVQFSYVDSALLQSLITYGVITMMLISIVFYLFEKKIIIAQNDFLLIAVAFTIINGFTDPQLFEPFYNVFFVLIGCLLINDTDAVELLRMEG